MKEPITEGSVLDEAMAETVRAGSYENILERLEKLEALVNQQDAEIINLRRKISRLESQNRRMG